MKKCSWRSDEGTQMVEMAVVLPFLVLLALGATDFARVSHASITLANAARAGAAFGVQSGGHAANGNGIRAAALAEAEALTPAIAVTSTNQCRCPGSTTPVSCTVGTCGAGGKELYLSVSATHTFQTLVPYPGIPASIAMQRSAVLRVR